MSDSGAGNPAAPGHQAALDGWRGVACLMVFWHHTGTAVELGPVTVRLDTGVQLFFVLSGYLIARPFLAAFASGGPSPSAGEYAAVRAVRILPPYLVALAGFVLARAATGQAVPSGWTVATRALLVSNYFPGENFFAINAVFWTLAIEAQFYALLPLAAWAVGRAVGKTPAGGCVLVALFLAAGPAARAAESWLVGPGALPTGQVRFRSTFAFLDQFGWGMAVALLSATGRRPGTNTLRLGAVAGAALFLAANAYAGLGVPKPDGDWLQSSDWLMVVAYPFALAAGLALVLLRATGGG